MIYTLGYGSVKPDDLHHWLATEDGLFVDVRLSPRSRDPHWRKETLQAQLGDRYVHLPEFGNRNYKAGDGAPVILADPANGLHRYRQLAARWPARKLVLVCACWSWAHCHRRDAALVVAEALGETESAIKHLGAVDVRRPPPPPAQRSMFE
jgi:uncharacterized protein (DUF488 family)